MSTGIEGELFYSGGWQHVRTYERDDVNSRWGQPDEGVVLGPAATSITLDNRSGDLNPDDARSDLYGLIGRNTPGRVTIDGGVHTVIEGVVASWDPDRDVEWDSADPSAGGDAWTGIVITGPAQRVNASKSIKSALRRTIDSMTQAGTGPAAYWPMEGFDREPDVVPSATPGVSGASHRTYPAVGVTSAFDWSGDSTLPGSQNLPTLSSNLLAIAGVQAYGYWTPNPAFGIAFWTRTQIPDTNETSALATSAIIGVLAAAGNIIYQIRVDTWPPGSTGAAVPANGEVSVAVECFDDSAGAAILIDRVVVADIAYADSWRHMYARMSTSGSDVDVTIMLDGAVVGTGTLTGANINPPLRRVTTNALSNDSTNVATGVISVGHTVLLTDSTANMDAFAAIHYQAGLGWPDETTIERFERLCDEANIPHSTFGSDPKSMGPQVPDTLPNLLLEIARTELGLIYDKRDEYALELRTGRSLYNQTAALALTYGVNVAPPIKPATDMLNVANDITATSRSGAVARTQRSSGPLNVSDPVDDPEGIGRTEGSTDVNPADDETLPDYAGSLLLASTWPGARYRNVTVNLRKHPDLLADVMAMRPGDLITLDDLDADQITLLALGGTHRLNSAEHVVTFNCTPAGPYRIGKLDDTPVMRIGSGSSSLAADFDAGSDTSLSVAVTDALWSTTAPPFNIRVGGIVLHVTAIAGASSPQTFTVDATPVNGISRLLLASGPDSMTRIDVADPAYIGA